MSEITHYSELKQDVALTNLTIGYGKLGNIASEIFPTVFVKSDNDIFYVWDDNGINTIGLDTKRSDRGQPKEISLGVTTDTYQVEQHALRGLAEDTMVKNADSVLAYRQAVAENVIDTLDLVREIEAKDLLFTATNYPTANKITLAGTDQWSNLTHVDSDPQADVAIAKNAVLLQSGAVLNTLVMGHENYTTLKRHDKAKEAIKYVAKTGDDDMTKAALASWLGVDRIIVGKARYNSAKEGQTVVPTFVWDSHVALIYTAPRVGINIPAFGYEFRPSHTPRTVETFRPQGTRAEAIDVNEKRVFKITFSKAGYLITDAFA